MSSGAISPAFAGHLAGFLERLRVLRYSPATVASREQCLRRFFDWLGQAGVTDARDVSQQTVRDFQASLLARPSCVNRFAMPKTPTPTTR